jgi:hypothetical protein
MQPQVLQLQPQPHPHPRAQQPSPSDMEVDVDVDGDGNESGAGVAGTSGLGAGGGASTEVEGAGVGMGMDRDGESDDIVRALEKGLPRWEGFEDVGWMADVGHVRSCFVCVIRIFLALTFFGGTGAACGYRAYYQELQRCNVSFSFVY